MAQVPTINGPAGNSIDYTPSSAVTGGDVVLVGNIVGVATDDIAASALGSLSVRGLKYVPKTTAAWVVGLPVYWNATGDPDSGSAGTGAANQLGVGLSMGIAALVAASGDDRGYVLMGESPAIASATVVATGNAQGDAAQIGLGFSLVSAADGTKGVILPAAAAGLQVTVKNIDAANAVLKVYPATSDAINAIAANSPISMGAKTCCTFTAYDGVTWYTNPLLPS